ncbi:hypothetical protein Poly41_22290 [Novipirellula artificiosorum]|uniref:Uncharacterized protein n=1 Tax=Novipirellula artificiosorum TaxID=2528016 RepID=A0A5C6DSX9_9BACT|nr:hypothetical protein Poly41_22290 [Novipirellula artificiosorum]
MADALTSMLATVEVNLERISWRLVQLIVNLLKHGVIVGFMFFASQNVGGGPSIWIGASVRCGSLD